MKKYRLAITQPDYMTAPPEATFIDVWGDVLILGRVFASEVHATVKAFAGRSDYDYGDARLEGERALELFHNTDWRELDQPFVTNIGAWEFRIDAIQADVEDLWADRPQAINA